MKQLLRKLITLGILGGLVYLIHASTPDAARHKQAIDARIQRLAENDPLKTADRLLHVVRDAVNAYPYEFHDYKLYSVMKNGDETVSLGFASRVFVFKNTFP